MNTRLMTAACSAIFSASVAAAATDTPAAASNYTLGGSVTVVSDYVVRGIDQTFGKPAVIGTLDFSHASGFYLGNYYANVNSGAGYPGGSLEMDFYGGRRFSVGAVALDAGAMYYTYPGTDAAIAGISNYKTGHTKNGGSISNKEIYLAATWSILTLKYTYAIGDYFSIPDTKNSMYVEAAISQPLADGWALNAHLGRMNLHNYDIDGITGNYTDWKLGVSKTVADWQLGLSWMGTNANGAPGQPYNYGNAAVGSTSYKNVGRNILQASLSKTF